MKCRILTCFWLTCFVMLFWSYWPVLLCCFGLIDLFCYVGLIDPFCYVVLVLLTCFVTLVWSYWPVVMLVLLTHFVMFFWSYWPVLLCCFGLIDTFCYVGLIDLFCYVILVLLTCFVMLFWSYWPVLLCCFGLIDLFCYVVLIYWPVLSCCFGLIDLFCYVILVFYGTLVTQNNITKQVSQKQMSIPHLNSHFSPFNTPLCVTFFSVPHYLQPWFQYKTLLRQSLLPSLPIFTGQKHSFPHRPRPELERLKGQDCCSCFLKVLIHFCSLSYDYSMR